MLGRDPMTWSDGSYRSLLVQIDHGHAFLRKFSISNWTCGLRSRAVEARSWGFLLILLVIVILYVSVDIPLTLRDFPVQNDTTKAGR